MKIFKRMKIAAKLFVWLGAASVLCLAGCKNDDSDSDDMTKMLVLNNMNAITGVSVTCESSSISSAGKTTLTASPTFNIRNDSSNTTYKWEITEGSSYASLSSEEGSSVTLSANVEDDSQNYSVSVKVTATYKDKSVVGTETITITKANTILLSDVPVGYASIDTSKFAQSITVSTKKDLVNYAKKGGYVIYVSGMIDMSEGMLPTSGGGSTTALDSFVKSKSTYSTYAVYKNAYVASCSETTNDKDSSKPESTVGSTMWTLNKTYGDKIKLTVESNTAIIGLDSSSGIKGGTIQISGKSNIVIRNLTIQDAYDPFPHHEKGDGYNAQWDGITIQGNSSNIWIDHCSFEDTMNIYDVSTGGSKSEKYQTYDGLCDIKGSGKGITVSYCKFYNHDKTMLIGSSDDEGNNSTRKITLHHNYFLDCEQRLPMVRNTTIHIFNNYFDCDSNGFYKNSYAVGVRAGSIVYAENNYFGSGIQYSFSADSEKAVGTLYSSGDSDNSSKKINSVISSSGTTLFSSAMNGYDYSSVLETADKVPADLEQNAGAGFWNVVKQ